MNTIYDGSFVLGNTSATTYQAGQGISITQPSEGTVRISNDETVLWSGSASMGSFTANLSEPATAFNEICFIAKAHPNNTIQEKISVNTKYMGLTGNQGSITIMGHAGGGGIRINNAQIATSANTNTIYFEQSKQFNITGTTITTASVSAWITEIRGINRISGGNA